MVVAFRAVPPDCCGRRPFLRWSASGQTYRTWLSSQPGSWQVSPAGQRWPLLHGFTHFVHFPLSLRMRMRSARECGQSFERWSEGGAPQKRQTSVLPVLSLRSLLDALASEGLLDRVGRGE